MAVSFADRALVLPDADALVLADLHVGRAAASDVDLPLGERDDLRTRLDGLLADHAPGTVVVAGDLLHAHDTLPRGVPDTVAALVDAVRDRDADLAVTPGNHDTHLGAVDALEGVTRADAVRLADGTVVCHGHEPPDLAADRYVVGHEHPAIEIEGRRHPCHLHGPAQYRGGDVVVVPAFTRLAAGTLVNRRRGGGMSPLVDDLGAFEPVVVADEPRRFPPLAELRAYL